MKNNKKIPRLRFPEFINSWEQYKLSELCEKITVGIANSATHAYTDKGVVMFRNQNIKENHLDDSDIIHIDSEFEKKYANKRLKASDLLITRTGYPGIACVVPEKYENAQTFTTLIARLKEGTNPFYACQYINSDYGKRFFAKRQIGGGQKNSGAGILGEFPMILPPTIAEQDRIAVFFAKIDSLITLHQLKLDAIKEYRKGMLQKLFPREGLYVPEIRFPGFNDPWKPCKFGELYYKSSEKNDGSIGMDKNITVATMQYKEDVKVSTDDYLKTYYTFKIGDIAFEGHQSKEYRFGRFVENDIGDGIVSHIFAVFRPKVEYDIRFWKYAINNEYLMQRVLARSTKASTMMHDLVADDFLAEEILVPNVAEQRIIGDFISTLDDLVALYQYKLDAIKEYKKGLLQQMLI